MPAFPQFAQFPAEIRLCVWEFSLPDDVPEVYIVGSVLDSFSKTVGSSGDGEENSDLIAPGPVRKVLIGIPAILHICHESRRVARANLSFVLLKTIASHQVQVPCRLYRPAFDSIFIPRSSFIPFGTSVIENRDQAIEDRFLRQIQHVALSAGEIYRTWDTLDGFRMLARFTALRQVSFIFGHEDDDDFTEDWCDDKWQRHRLRHFRVDEWTEEEGHLIHATSDTIMNIKSVLDDVSANFTEIGVEDGGPWGEEAGEWLFEPDAKKLVVQPLGWQQQPRSR
ncbi:hypothetical protein GQ53DRAFT_820364 [Thozetella sp. PMI_491]|nr:hypothetical protein GQ53DRAFT_820364 [Thozetella sp. PMI_491]